MRSAVSKANKSFRSLFAIAGGTPRTVPSSCSCLRPCDESAQVAFVVLLVEYVRLYRTCQGCLISGQCPEVAGLLGGSSEIPHDFAEHWGVFALSQPPPSALLLGLSFE